MTAPRPIGPVAVIAAVVLAGATGAAAIVAVRGPWADAVSATSPAAASVGRAVPPAPQLVPTPAHSAKAIMVGLVDPAADGIWNSAGSITTATSEERWAPATDADWRRLEAHARAIIRGADALADPTRTGGREDWAAPARALRASGQVALDAARRRDVAGLDVASEGLLDSCQQCHARYWIPAEATP
jgi:hypothetical protein